MPQQSDWITLLLDRDNWKVTGWFSTVKTWRHIPTGAHCYVANWDKVWKFEDGEQVLVSQAVQDELHRIGKANLGPRNNGADKVDSWLKRRK